MTRQRDDKAAEKLFGGKALELVAYQAGAVVSREILKKKTGSVTAFAFDQGQGLSEHTAPFDALVQVLEGAAEIAIGGEPRRVAHRRLLPATQLHGGRLAQVLIPSRRRSHGCLQLKRPA